MAYSSKEVRKAQRRKNMREHHEWAVRQWQGAFSEDWHYEYLLQFLRAKLVTMARYNKRLSYVMNGPYYGSQINRAIAMIDIVLDDGGRYDYDKDSFPFTVNMRNRSRIPRANDDGKFWNCDAQRLRFDKAWMLLWRILSEQMMIWGD